MFKLADRIRDMSENMRQLHELRTTKRTTLTHSQKHSSSQWLLWPLAREPPPEAGEHETFGQSSQVFTLASLRSRVPILLAVCMERNRERGERVFWSGAKYEID